MEQICEFICTDHTFKMSRTFIEGPHNVGTIFYKEFVENNFKNETSIFVPFNRNVFSLVIPMIRDGTICVPKPKYLSELDKLLRFFAGENTYWEKMATLFSDAFILDPYSRAIWLYAPGIVGKFFTATTASFYESYSIDKEIKIRDGLIAAAAAVHMTLKFLRSSKQSPESHDSYHAFRSRFNGNDGVAYDFQVSSNLIPRDGMIPFLCCTQMKCNCSKCKGKTDQLLYNKGCVNTTAEYRATGGYITQITSLPNGYEKINLSIPKTHFGYNILDNKIYAGQRDDTATFQAAAVNVLKDTALSWTIWV